MTKEQILEFLNQNPVFYLATTEGNQPRVRAMLMARADSSGILFHVGKNKDLYRQLEANPAVELCYYNAADGIQVRVTGTARREENIELKKEIVEKHDFLKPMVEKAGYDFLALYRLAGGTATVWKMSEIAAPKTFITL